MKIGIDIDDTTFLTVKSMLKYADIFEEEISGQPTNRDNFGLITNLMTTKMNEKIDAGEIIRVNNWNDIYNEIQKLYSIYSEEVGD